MKKSELDIWYKYLKALKNDWHFEPADYLSDIYGWLVISFDIEQQ